MISFTTLPNFDLVIVLGHSNEDSTDSNKISFDATIRARAAGILYQNKRTSKIVVIGGGNDQISHITEAQKITAYIIKTFSVSNDDISSNGDGINTLEDISLALKYCRKQKIDTKKVAFITSNYNTQRIAIILEILGFTTSLVLSAEVVLLQSNDNYTTQIYNYFDSLEYQKRLNYESYWAARTLYDEGYTKVARDSLEVKTSPIDYFKSQNKREMEDFDE